MSKRTPLSAFQIIAGLADEGVPVRVMARAFRLPVADVYGMVQELVGDGRLLKAPGYDWRHGDTAPTEAPALKHRRATTTGGFDTLAYECRRLFHFTDCECRVFLAVVRGVRGLNQQLLALGEDASRELFNVYVHKIRRKLRAMHL